MNPSEKSMFTVAAVAGACVITGLVLHSAKKEEEIKSLKVKKSKR